MPLEPFTEIVESWYEQNKRSLPWRGIKDPYKIWISEVILQQTRVVQGLNYYKRFIESFPTVERLSAAKIEDVLQLWQGLGYYSRARNLHYAAQQIVNLKAFPNSYKKLLQLKGIGEYTAAAIASFAFNETCAAVDGNVFRVLSRYFGIDYPIDSTEGKKYFQALANELIDKTNPGLFNQAVMEFGALQCIPHKPNCLACPLIETCFAYNKKQIEILPVKKTKVKIKQRYFTYIYIQDDENIYLRKRSGKDIWEGLYEPLLLEFDSLATEEEILKHPFVSKLMKQEQGILTYLKQNQKHQLTHQIITAQFYLLNILSGVGKSSLRGFEKVKKDRRSMYAVSRLVELLYEKVDAYHNNKNRR